MCGRYSLSTPLEELVETFDVEDVVGPLDLPRYNVAPTQEVPVIVRGRIGRRMGAVRWGFTRTDARRSATRLLINARSETVAVLPAFREAFRQRRCLVPVDGFFEWEASERGAPRLPHWIHRPDRRPFALAGLWQRSQVDGREVVEFTILTTEANDALRALHDRMPVVLSAEAAERWLLPDADARSLRELLVPAPDALLEAWRVSTAVNTASVDEPSCTAPTGPGRPG